MFGLKKHVVPVYKDQLIEHILGYVLVFRADIIPNRVFVDKEHELNGMIGFNVGKLSDELDYVVLQYAYRFFIEKGVSVEKLDRMLSNVLDRFVKEEVIIKEDRQSHYNLMTSRVHEYLNMESAAKIGMAFMSHVVEGHDALSDDTGRYVAPVLKTLEVNIQKRINAELAI
jgi:hypothetical protein